MATDSVLVGTGIAIPSIHVAKIVAVTGADWCWIDAEHTPFGSTMLADIVQTVQFHSEGKMVPVVRVPGFSHEWMATALDAGAGGIIIPHTETVEQVHGIMESCLYPPLGKRSFPPFALLPGLTDLPGKPLERANEHVAILPQIESQLGIDNLEEIMQIPGIAAIMIGTGDLHLDLGLGLRVDSDEPSFLKCMDRVKTLAVKYNMPICGYVGAGEMVSRIDMGYRMVAASGDAPAIAFGIVSETARARSQVAEWQASKTAASSTIPPVTNGVKST